MANEAKKNLLDEPEKSRKAITDAPRRRSRTAAETLPNVHRDNLTPEALSAVGQLMAELERVKDELLAARKRVTELENKVDEDTLLPVLNRRGFDRELERTLAYVKRHGTDVSLIYIDLDDFKSINDIHGHAAGDAALMHVSDILLANVRRSDVVARLGGDEFAILLHRADEDAATAKADQLARGLTSSALVHDGKEIPVSLTSGTVQLRGGDTGATALARADRLMYANKARRKHR